MASFVNLYEPCVWLWEYSNTALLVVSFPKKCVYLYKHNMLHLVHIYNNVHGSLWQDGSEGVGDFSLWSLMIWGVWGGEILLYLLIFYDQGIERPPLEKNQDTTPGNIEFTVKYSFNLAQIINGWSFFFYVEDRCVRPLLPSSGV